MSDDARDRLKEALLRGGELKGAERETFLARLRDEDPALAAEVDSLLAQRTREELAGRGLTGLVAAAAAEIEAEATAASPDPGTARRLGPYTLAELIGTGGMGAVYRATQEEPIRREVAVKLLRGGLDPAKVLARFEGERRALALVDHPGIARILDAGADEHGTPYLVMELVRGIPITAYCREKQLPRRELLALFVSVCRAVQHAHQKGIIHRDLKPSNILVHEVDGKPVAKIIDFGIARVVEEDGRPHTLITGEGQIVGTLEYMSPEQAAGRSREIDTRTDVYSLGAVLYELLTGSLPHDLTGKSLAESVETIRREPARPFKHTTTERRYDSDLETIVRKALETEPSRRYDGPAALADDLERYLRSEPIVARPPSTIYQLRKLVSRHRTAYAVGAGAFLFLVIFGITMSVLYAGQRRERERAENEVAKESAMNGFLQGLLASADPSRLGKDVTVRHALDASLSGIDSAFATQPEIRASVERNLANTYFALGEFPRADSLYRASITLERRDPRGQTRELAGTLREEATCLEGMNRYDDAVAPAREALALTDRLYGHDSVETAECLERLGVAIELGHRAEAESLYTEAVAIAARVSGKESPEYAKAQRAWSRGPYRRGDWPAMEKPLRESLAILTRVYGPHHPETLETLSNLASTLSRIPGRRGEALELHRQAFDAFAAVYGREHEATALEEVNFARDLMESGNFADAEHLLLEANSVTQRDGFLNREVSTYRALGTLYHLWRRYRDAEVWYQRAIDRAAWSMHYALMAELMVDEGRGADAVRAAEDGARAAIGDVGTDWSPTVARFMYLTGEGFLTSGNLDSASVWLSRSLDRLRSLASDSEARWLAESAYGICLDRMARHAEGDSLLARSASPILEKSDDSVDRRTALCRLAAYYREIRQPDRATPFEAAFDSLPGARIASVSVSK